MNMAPGKLWLFLYNREIAFLNRKEVRRTGKAPSLFALLHGLRGSSIKQLYQWTFDKTPRKSLFKFYRRYHICADWEFHWR